MVKISVIVPVFNAGRYIDRCIVALLEQDYPRSNYEIIAVDNGSTDDSFDRLRRYPVKVVQEPKLGSYAARNAGLLHASGSLLGFTDADCVPCARWLTGIDTVMDDLGTEIVLGERRFATRSALMRAVNDYEVSKDISVLKGTQRLKYYGYTNNLGMRRDTYDRYGPFIECSRGADTIFVRNVVDNESCKAVCFSSDMVVDHLEMKVFKDYVKKMFIYGRSMQNYGKITPTQPLSFPERIEILKTSARDGRYSAFMMSSLLLSLGVAFFAWQFGFWIGASECVKNRRR